MRWLDALLNRLVPHHTQNRSQELELAFRGTARAQDRVVEAARQAKDAAAEHRTKVDAVRARIVERSETHERRRRKGQTSETLSLVADMLRDSGQVADVSEDRDR